VIEKKGTKFSRQHFTSTYTYSVDRGNSVFKNGMCFPKYGTDISENNNLHSHLCDNLILFVQLIVLLSPLTIESIMLSLCCTCSRPNIQIFYVLPHLKCLVLLMKTDYVVYRAEIRVLYNPTIVI